jgi:hypothetical protein
MIDNNAILKDAGVVTSSGYGTVDEEAKVVNLGAGLIRGNLVVDISAIKVSAKDEKYTLHLMGGTDASFTGQVSIASKELGAHGALEGNRDSKISRVVIPFQNEERGIIYPYCRIRHVIAGSSPSINYTARLEKDLPVTGTTGIDQAVTTTSSTTTTTT